MPRLLSAFLIRITFTGLFIFFITADILFLLSIKKEQERASA